MRINIFWLLNLQKKIRNTRQESTVLQPWDQLDDVVSQGRGMEYHLLNGHSPFFVGSDME